MYPGGYTVEVTCLSHRAKEKDLHEFFSHCGPIEHLEIVRSGEFARTAYITFKDAYALETAVLLSGATIVDQRVCIIQWGNYTDDFYPWRSNSWKADDSFSPTGLNSSGPSITSPGEAVTMTQEVVKIMLAKGYDLGKDTLSRAKAFDESYRVSATATAKMAELSNRFGLGNKFSAGVEAVRSVDQRYLVTERTKSAASFTGRTANTVVNNGSSYISKGAGWVSEVFVRASKAAVELSRNGNMK